MTPTPPTIRAARRDEAETLTALAMASKRSNGYDDAFMAACVEELRVTAALLEAHDWYVADDGGQPSGVPFGEPCGVACLRATHADIGATTGEIASFFVHPDRQGRGIGRLLWRAVERTARERGMTALHLDADPGAEAFYARLGFVTVGRVPSGSIPGRTLPHMRIDLTPPPRGAP